MSDRSPVALKGSESYSTVRLCGMSRSVERIALAARVVGLTTTAGRKVTRESLGQLAMPFSRQKERTWHREVDCEGLLPYKRAVTTVIGLCEGNCGK